MKYMVAFFWLELVQETKHDRNKANPKTVWFEVAPLFVYRIAGLRRIGYL